MHDFVVTRAPFFTALCADGSHPTAWQQYHAEYKGLFEEQLHRSLYGLDILQQDFESFCEWLKVNADVFQEDTEGLYPFLEAITASLDARNGRE